MLYPLSVRWITILPLSYQTDSVIASFILQGRRLVFYLVANGMSQQCAFKQPACWRRYSYIHFMTYGHFFPSFKLFGFQLQYLLLTLFTKRFLRTISSRSYEALNVLFCGLAYTTVANMAKVLHMPTLNERPDFRRNILLLTSYVHQQDALFAFLRGKQLKLPSDGHCDSPGYSAKCCTYSLMDNATYPILDYSGDGQFSCNGKKGLEHCLTNVMFWFHYNW